MGISIKNAETERLARQLALETGESLTDAIKAALDERLARLRRGRTADLRRSRAESIIREFNALPDLDSRPATEIIDDAWGGL
jgi:antitoxin VapB